MNGTAEKPGVDGDSLQRRICELELQLAKGQSGADWILALPLASLLITCFAFCSVYVLTGAHTWLMWLEELPLAGHVARYAIDRYESLGSSVQLGKDVAGALMSALLALLVINILLSIATAVIHVVAFGISRIVRTKRNGPMRNAEATASTQGRK